MSETAAAIATPAPNAAPPSSEPETASAASVVDDDTPPKEANLEAHIEHAVRQGKRKEAANKAKETKAAKKNASTTAPSVTKAETKSASAADADTESAAEAQAQEEQEEETEEKPARRGKTPRQLADEGDLDGAFELAFGKKPQDFGINSKRWAEYRQVVARDKRAIAQREQQAHQLIAQAKEELRPFVAFRDAKKAYDDGDFETAIKMAFGDDVTSFNKKLIGRMHGKNPEVEQVRAELRALKEERQREEQQRLAERQEYEVQQQREQYLQTMQQSIIEEGDSQLQRLAKKPAFVRQVFAILQHHYDEASDTTLPFLEAADMARNALVEEYGDAFESRDAGVPAVSVRGGSNPARPVGTPTRTLSQKGAAETSAPPRGAHGLTLDEQVRMFVNGAA